MSDRAEPAVKLDDVRILLLGMMGSGKSSVGLALRRHTGWPFVDNDVLVESATGHTARELLAARGEAALREAESAALETALTLPPPVIAATAAGTVLEAGNRRRLAGGGFVVWLHAPAEVLATRAVGAVHRPWLDDDPIAWFRDALHERTSLYESVADLAVDTSRLTPDECAAAVVEALERRRTDSIRA
jgi:shikimate kinase